MESWRFRIENVKGMYFSVNKHIYFFKSTQFCSTEDVRRFPNIDPPKKYIEN